MAVEDLEVGSVLDSGIHSVISSVDTPAVDSEARGCAAPGRESKPWLRCGSFSLRSQ